MKKVGIGLIVVGMIFFIFNMFLENSRYETKNLAGLYSITTDKRTGLVKHCKVKTNGYGSFSEVICSEWR
jgi:hypothetical protein